MKKTNFPRPNFVPAFNGLDKDKQDSLLKKFIISHNLNVLHQITDYILKYNLDDGILDYLDKSLNSFIGELDIALNDHLKSDDEYESEK